MDYNYHKKFNLICEKCNCISEHSVSVFYDNIEVAKDFYMEFTNEYYCKNCNEVTFQFDVEPRIAKSVRLLRLHGYDTRFSCEGHSKLINDKGKLSHNTSFPYICFVEKELPDNFERIINNYGWKLERHILDDENILRLGYTYYFEGDESDVEEYVNKHNEKFIEADKKLFRALLEAFIEELPE